jgi:hypothetical protein
MPIFSMPVFQRGGGFPRLPIKARPIREPKSGLIDGAVSDYGYLGSRLKSKVHGKSMFGRGILG